MIIDYIFFSIFFILPSKLLYLPVGIKVKRAMRWNQADLTQTGIFLLHR